MESVPDVPKCFGMFAPKYATYLISLIGIGIGGCGLAGIILYGLVENSIVAHFVKTQPSDDTVKKVVLLTIGLTSLLIFCGSILLFLGLTCRSSGSLTAGAWTLLVMCIIVTLEAVGAPMSCFFLPKACIIKKLSAPLFTLGYIVITIHLWIWLYFVVVVFNHVNAL